MKNNSKKIFWIGIVGIILSSLFSSIIIAILVGNSRKLQLKAPKS